MNRRVVGVAALAGIALGVVTWLVSGGPSDEERIRQRLDRLAAAVSVKGDENVIVRTGRLRSEFHELLAEQASASVPELGVSRSGRRDLADAAAQAGLRFHHGQVSLVDVHVQVEPDRKSGEAKATARLSGSWGGDLRDEVRRVTFRVDKVDGEWLVSSVAVSPRDR